MRGRPRCEDDGSLSHGDLLAALFEALDVDGEEDRRDLRERYFDQLQAERELCQQSGRRFTRRADSYPVTDADRSTNGEIVAHP